MKVEGNVVLHQEVDDLARDFEPVGRPVTKCILSFVKRCVFKGLRSLPLTQRYLLLAKCRENLFDETCEVFHTKGEDEMCSGVSRAVFSYAQYPETTPVGHRCFSKKLENVELVSPGLIPWFKRSSLANEAISINPYFDFKSTTNEGRLLKTKSPVKMMGKYGSLVSHWTFWKNYYHWFLDVLPRLEHIESDRRILLRSPVAKYEEESLRLLGVWDRCELVEGDFLEVEDFQFVSPSAYAGAYAPESIEYLRKQFLKCIEDTDEKVPQKIYVSRRGQDRSPANEEEIEKLFSSHGWTILEPQNHSVKDQIGIFNKATHIAGVHGAGLTNVLWATSGAKMFEMFSSDRMVATNENIALHVGVEYTGVVFPPMGFKPCHYDIELIKKAIINHSNT